MYAIADFVDVESWTLYYGKYSTLRHYFRLLISTDTIYACQDKKDDVKAGIKSTAVLFGDDTKSYLTFFATVLMINLITAGALNRQGPAFYAITVLGSIVFLHGQLTSVNLNDVQECLEAVRTYSRRDSLFLLTAPIFKFESNAFKFGFIVWFGLLAEYLLS